VCFRFLYSASKIIIFGILKEIQKLNLFVLQEFLTNIFFCTIIKNSNIEINSHQRYKFFDFFFFLNENGHLRKFIRHFLKFNKNFSYIHPESVMINQEFNGNKKRWSENNLLKIDPSPFEKIHSSV